MTPLNINELQQKCILWEKVLYMCAFLVYNNLVSNCNTEITY